MKKIIQLILVVGIVYATAANAQDASKIKTDVSDQTKEEILRLNSEIEKSFTDADPLKISGFYDDDAIIMMDGLQVKGRKELSGFWNNITDRKDFKIEVTEIGGSGKYVYQTGIITWNAAGNQIIKKFMMVWKRLSNYEYKIYLTGFN